MQTYATWFCCCDGKILKDLHILEILPSCRSFIVNFFFGYFIEDWEITTSITDRIKNTHETYKKKIMFHANIHITYIWFKWTVFVRIISHIPVAINTPSILIVCCPLQNLLTNSKMRISNSFDLCVLISMRIQVFGPNETIERYIF